MKKKILNFLQTNVLPFILSLFVRFIYWTNKRVFHLPSNIPNTPFLMAFWHGELLMQPFLYKKINPTGKFKAMISEHRDGEAIAKTVGFLGVGAIRGSSTRGAAKVLLSAIKELKRGTADIGITPDGPKGPRHSVADGIIAVAQKTNSPILCLNVNPKKYWQFNSWDKFTIPKPFSQIDFYVSAPFYINDLEKEDAKALIKDKMMKKAMP